MRNRDEKRRAEQVDRYIEQDATDTNALDAKTEQVIDTLHRAAAETRPRPGFINELANQLREQETTMSEKPTRTFWGIASRLLLGGAAVAAVAVFALYLSGVFGTPALEPAVSENETPPGPVLQTEGGQHFPGAEFEVMVPLSDEGGEVPLYTVQQTSLPDTVDAALALAERFGLDNATVYEMPSDPNRWTVMEAGGRNISFRIDEATLEGIYYTYGSLRPTVAEGEPVTEAEAEQAAVAFLEEAGMLPDGFETEVSAASTPVRNVTVIPVVEGHPLAGNQNQIEIGVGPDGNVIHARINLPQFEPTGESVPIKPAEQAFTELVEGTGSSMSYSFERAPAMIAEQPRFFVPPAAEHERGEEVTLVGWLTFLMPVAEGEPRVVLHPASGVTYYLRGPAVAELAESPPQGMVLVSGTIDEKLRPQEWVLSASEVQPHEASFECKTGLITTDRETTILESDQGESFRLAYAAEGLASGVRAEVCAGNFGNEQPVEWLQITSPPVSEGATSGGGGGGVSVAVETVEEVQVERAVTEEDIEVEEAGEAPPPPDSAAGSGGSGGRVAPEVAAQPSPYALGDTVEVTGIVEGLYYLEGGMRTPEISLRYEETKDGKTHFFVYPLLGDPQLLEEIAEENQLHIRVTGQVVSRPEGRPGTHDQALVAESFERVYPEEAIEAFLGNAGQDVVDGEEIPVFIDAESGQRYALNYPLSLTGEHEGRTVWAAGVVDPEQTIGGLPLLRVYESRTGNEVDEAEEPGDIGFDPEMPVIDRSEMGQSDLQGTLIVARVELGYKYEQRPTPPVPTGEEPAGAEEPVLLEPTWFFYGQTEDGTTTFVIEVPATAGSGGGRE